MSPFNEDRYKTLLEGLEISEVLVSELYSHLRIDADTYRPFYVDIENAILKKNYTTLGKISQVFKKGIFDIKASVYSNAGIPFVRISNLKNMGISTNDLIYIPKDENERNINTFLKRGDIILSKTAYPAASIVQIESCNTSQDTVAIKLKDDCFIDSAYLVVFLNSKYGFYQMQRWFTGNIQMHLNLIDSKGIFVYKSTANFQNTISEVFWKSYEILEQYQIKYNEAETLLLETLGIRKFQPSNKSVNVKCFNESFGTSGRLDPEYYHPKYEDYSGLIKDYKNGYDTVSSICSIKDKNFNPYEELNYKYIELANIGKTGEIIDCIYKSGEELPTRARRRVSENDVIISSIEGSLDSCALITPEYDNALCSTGFYVINSDKLNSETLLVLFKSAPIQNLLKKGCSGTILTAISKKELEQIPLPLIEENIQSEIKTKINESFTLREESEKLLELSKKAVEKAIEEDEQAAIDFITENIN